MEEPQLVQQTQGPGIRDAEEILLRAQEDERDAIEARTRYRAHGLPVLAVDGPVAERLRADETAVDARTSARASCSPCATAHAL